MLGRILHVRGHLQKTIACRATYSCRDSEETVFGTIHKVNVGISTRWRREVGCLLHCRKTCRRYCRNFVNVTLCGVLSLVTLSSALKVDKRLSLPKFDLDKIVGVCSVNFIRHIILAFKRCVNVLVQCHIRGFSVRTFGATVQFHFIAYYT